MKSSIIIALSSTIFSLSLGSPHPEAEADPGLLKVIKTVQIWDDEEQALQDARIVEDLDIHGLNVEYDVNDFVVPSHGLSEEVDLSTAKVIKTVQIWDDEEQALQDGRIVEDLDINGLNVEYDVNDFVVPSHGLSEEIDLSPVSDSSPQGRTLIGAYVGGRFQPASHDASHNHHHGHGQEDHTRHQTPDKYPYALNNNGLDGSTDPDLRDIDLNKLPGAENLPTFTTDDGLECVKKMMMTEYTEYEETVTCVHKVEERCHESYVTDFEPTQQRECDEKFEKRCSIYYEDVAVPDVVEVCKTDIAYNCDKQGPRECETIYDTVCETTRTVHTVEDDVANCQVKQEVDTACVEANKVRVPKVKCDTWPRQVCTTEKVSVNRTTPDTKCRQESRELCANKPCLEEQVVQCANETKTVIVSKPKEECDMEPHQTCRFITKMVPHLRSREECVDVPQEVCGTSRAPIKKQRPSIMNWCYIPESSTPTPSTPRPTPPPPPPPGQVLLKELEFRDFDLASSDDLGLLGDEISIELFGEITVANPNGVTCSFSFDDFQSYGSSIIDDKEMTLGDQDNLGGCYKSPLNNQISEGGSVTVSGSKYKWSTLTMCINWFVEAGGVERFPFSCALIATSNADKYNLDCQRGGVCYDGQSSG